MRYIRANDKVFFDTFAWAFQALRQHVAVAKHDHDIPYGLCLSCDTCAPLLPATRWTYRRPGMNEFGIRPYEDPESATKYEVALKERPSIFTVQSTINPRNALGDMDVQIVIALNHIALCQRARAKLGKMTTSDEQTTSWSLDTNFPKTANAPLVPFTLLSNTLEEEFALVLPGRLSLWKQQAQSLSWMRNQEAGPGQSVTLEAIEEAMLPHIGWRAEARAKTKIHARGGILADHPGFGKTITSLSLVHAEFQDYKDSPDPHQAIINGMDDLPHQQPIKIAATLIICPSILTRQWIEEILQILGEGYESETLLVENVGHLGKLTINDFRAARLIVLNRELLGRETYLKRVAEYAGVPAPGKASKKRMYKAWVEEATKEVIKHVNIMQKPGGAALLAKTITDKLKHRLEDSTMRTFAWSKRLKGKKYQADKTKKASVHKEAQDNDAELLGEFNYTPKAAQLETTVLFEMFHFNRIIVDEFSYVLENESGAMTSVTALQADKRWALSATPPLRDPHDVAKLARLVGISVPSAVSMPGLVSSKNLDSIREDMTNVELFETFREAPSHILVRRVQECAQRFLDAFVRQNVLEQGSFPFIDFLVPVTLGLNHTLVYAELLQQLDSQDMRLKPKTSTQGLDREERIAVSSRDAQDAEDALSNQAVSYTASQLRSDKEKKDNNDPARGDSDNVDVEEEEDEQEHLEEANSGNQDADDEDDNEAPSSNALYRTRHQECQALKQKLQAAIFQAQRLDAELEESAPEYCFEIWQDQHLGGKEIGDAEAVSFITDAVTLAKQEHSPLDRGTAAGKKVTEDGKKAAELAKRASREVTNLAKLCVAAVRSIRFVDNAQRLHERGTTAKTCDFRNCASRFTDLAVSCVCGHIVCDTCLDNNEKSVVDCGAASCNSTIQDIQLLWSSKISSCPLDAEEVPGRKIDVVVDLLKDISNRKEQAILFMRQTAQMKSMQAVLDAQGVHCVAIKNSRDVKDIATFQQDKDKKITVIILNADDESAAGTNLPEANHVIFMSPLLETEQHIYDAQMAQAIGRARRPGQKRLIRIYRMVALNTIDVDILEHRERSKQIRVEKPVNVWDDEDGVEGDTDISTADDTALFSDNEHSDEVERTQFIKDTDGRYKLVPKSLLLRRPESEGTTGVEGRNKVKGFEEFGTLMSFHRSYNGDD